MLRIGLGLRISLELLIGLIRRIRLVLRISLIAGVVIRGRRGVSGILRVRCIGRILHGRTHHAAVARRGV